MGDTRALGPRRFNFTELTANDFEILCYLVEQLEFPDVVRLRAPENGADSALPAGEDRVYRRCWQPKRFAGPIAWGQCRESLERAIAAYGIPHYTFCFARDLTGSQEAKFKQQLAGRYPGVTVDYWGSSRLLAALSTGPGERIAHLFYEDERYNARSFMQALRAGGPLETGADAMQRLEAIAEWLVSHDPFFSYPVSIRESGIGAPAGSHPGAVMIVERSHGEHVERIEAIPRSPEATAQFGPAASLIFDETPIGQAAFIRFRDGLNTGQAVDLEEGVRVHFERLPPFLRELIEDAPVPRGISIRPAAPAIPPWNAHFHARTDRGDAGLDLDLSAVVPAEGWAAALSGSKDGLSVTVSLRKIEERSQARFHWSYTAAPTHLRNQMQVLALLDAMRGIGDFEVSDRDQQRPALAMTLPERPVPEGIPGRLALLRDLVTIEVWTGEEMTLPADLAAERLSDIANAAYMIRHGHSNINFGATLNLPNEKLRDLQVDPPPPLAVVVPVRLRTDDGELLLGHLHGPIDPWRIASIEPSDQPGHTHVRIESDRGTKLDFAREHPRATDGRVASH